MKEMTVAEAKALIDALTDNNGNKPELLELANEAYKLGYQKGIEATTATK